jgi:hypothetical protein
LAVPKAAEVFHEAIVEVFFAEDSQGLTLERLCRLRHGLQQSLDGLFVHPIAGDEVRQIVPG